MIKTQMLYTKYILAGVFFFALGSAAIFAEQNQSISSLIYGQHQLQQEGAALVKTGRYEKAIEKFREALQPHYIKFESDKGMAKYSITHILILIGKYDAALNEYQWFLDQNKKGENYVAMVHAKEIESLKEYQSAKNPKLILNYIPLLRDQYASSLPPQGYDSGIGIGQISTIFRLYDTIGDYDAGIAFIDETMNFLKNRKADRKEDATIYDRIKTSQEAETCAGLEKNPKDRNPEWRACKIIRAYRLIREAFEHDKAEGYTGCAGAKPRMITTPEGDEICMGRATHALIQSDYFPW